MKGEKGESGRKESTMALKMTNREVDGRVVLGAEGDALREELQKLGKKKIVLNMNNIQYIDSAGWEHWSPRI